MTRFASGSKYGNRKTVLDGEVFDSEKEARRWATLKLMERAGLISDLRRQVKLELIPRQGEERAVNYIADFVYTEKGKTVYEDCKGYKTDVYIMKRKMAKYLLHIDIKET